MLDSCHIRFPAIHQDKDMNKSRHFGWAAVAFGLSSAGFVLGGYLALGAGLAALTATYAGLSYRARVEEKRDA